MNTAELIKDTAEKSGVPQVTARRVLEMAGEIARDALKKGDDVPIIGIGILGTVERAARTGRNPQTGESISIPAKRATKLRVSKLVKDLF